MGYSIAYNSGSTTPFGTYKQGTITMGLKPDEYTVSSGFTWYANAETPNDNYLIISDTYSQGWSTQAESKPTIWRSETGTSESFVALVNQLPNVNGITGFTDSGTAMRYLMDSGKYFVFKDDYLGILTDGLVLNLDAGWYPSYSGSGTIWYDLSGKDNHAYMASKNSQNPVFNIDKFYFDGNSSQSYFYNGSAPTLSGDGVTVFLICEPSSYNDTTNGRLYAMDTRYSISKGYNGNKNPGVGIGFDRVNSTNLKTFNFVTNESNGGSYTEAKTPNNYQYSTKYISMARREAGSSDITVLGTDSETIVNPSYSNKGLSSDTIPSDGYVIGCFNGNPWTTFPNYWFSGYIYQVLMYNRYLSDSEVNHMISILKTKYNI